MEKQTLQGLIDLSLSQREIARKLGISQTNIRYWLNKHKLNTNNLPFNSKIIDEERICGVCKEKLPISEFYFVKGKEFTISKCKNCVNRLAHEKQKATKLKMIAYKGNKCEKCNTKVEDLHPSVFEFHHINPLTKDINFSSVKGWGWDRIQKEIDKCILLCANCHRMEHVKLGGNSFSY